MIVVAGFLEVNAYLDALPKRLDCGAGGIMLLEQGGATSLRPPLHDLESSRDPEVMSAFLEAGSI